MDKASAYGAEDSGFESQLLYMFLLLSVLAFLWYIDKHPSRSSTNAARLYLPCGLFSSNTRLAQSVERWPFKPVVMGSSPMVGDSITQTEEILVAKCCLHNLLPV